MKTKKLKERCITHNSKMKVSIKTKSFYSMISSVSLVFWPLNWLCATSLFKLAFWIVKSCLWMLEEHVWIISHPNVWVCSYSYQSGLFGLFGLETLKYWNHQLLDTKRSQKHEKIIKFSYSSPVAFEMAFTTFVGLFLVFNRFLISHKASGTRWCPSNGKV